MPVLLRLENWLRRNGWRASARSTAALQFGPKEIRFARIERDGAGAPAVTAWSHEQGSAEHRIEHLRQLAQSGLTRGARVSHVLSPGEYDLHLLAPPAVPEDEQREALRWSLREVLHYSPDEATLDFVRLPSSDNGRAQLLVVSARKTLLAEIARQYTVAEVPLDVIDIAEFAQRNLRALLPASEGTTGWLSLETDAALLTLQLGSELCFARRIQLPMLSAIDSTDLSYDSGGTPPSQGQRVATHVLRSLDLFERQSGLPHVMSMMIAPHPQAEAVAAALTEQSGIATQVFDTLRAMNLSQLGAAPDPSLAWRLFPVLGAALRQDQDRASSWMSRFKRAA